MVIESLASKGDGGLSTLYNRQKAAVAKSCFISWHKNVLENNPGVADVVWSCDSISGAGVGGLRFVVGATS